MVLLQDKPKQTLCLSLQVLGLKLPNMLGRAEKLTFQFSYGTKETSYGLSFFKPQPGHFERKYVSELEVSEYCVNGVLEYLHTS